jgi:hypothetical protein
MGTWMGAKQMAQRLSFDLQSATETTTYGRFISDEPGRGASAARVIPNYLRVRESFAGH